MPVNPNITQLDQQQILQRVFDVNNDALRTDAFVQVDTINADLTVDIKAVSGDNIAITNQDGTNPLHVNSDGSINVVITNPISIAGISSSYNEILSVASNNLTTIINKTMVSSGKLVSIDVSGDNIAEYTVLLNSSTINKARTYFGSELNHMFDFKDGILVNSGDIIQVQVIHTRPSLSNFNARIQTTG